MENHIDNKRKIASLFAVLSVSEESVEFVDSGAVVDSEVFLSFDTELFGVSSCVWLTFVLSVSDTWTVLSFEGEEIFLDRGYPIHNKDTQHRVSKMIRFFMKFPLLDVYFL